MARIRYDIIPQGGGWSIAMGGAVGPPYSELGEAIRDAENVASSLVRGGDEVTIVVWRGGRPCVLETLQPWMEPRPKASV